MLYTFQKKAQGHFLAALQLWSVVSQIFYHNYNHLVVVVKIVSNTNSLQFGCRMPSPSRGIGSLVPVHQSDDLCKCRSVVERCLRKPNCRPHSRWLVVWCSVIFVAMVFSKTTYYRQERCSTIFFYTRIFSLFYGPEHYLFSTGLATFVR